MRDRRPPSSSHPDVVATRVWLDDVARSLSATGLSRQDRRRLKSVVAAHDAGGVEKDHLRSLIAVAVVRRVQISGPAPDAVPPGLVVDLAVDMLWPVVLAEELPPDWLAELRVLTSARVAVVIHHVRALAPAQRDRVLLYRALASVDVRPALINLMRDLSDPKRGGAILGAVCAGADVAMPSKPGPAEVFRWIVVGTAAAGASGVIGNRLDALVVSAWNGLVDGGGGSAGATELPTITSSGGGDRTDIPHRPHGSFIDDLFSSR